MGSRGDTTRFAYDAVGCRTRTTDTFGGDTLQTYDESGNLIALTAPLGHVTRFEYATFDLDGLRRVVHRGL